MEPAAGIEPATDGLQNRCSTAELSWRQPHLLRGRRWFGKPTREKLMVHFNFGWGERPRESVPQLRA